MVKSSGSGAPYFTKKSNLKEECYEIVNSFRNEAFDEHVFNMPNVIYRVVQASKSGKFKGRLVYCPPFAITCLELMFGCSVSDHFVGNKDSSVIMGHKQMYLYELNKRLKDYNKCSGDYSFYDQALPSFIIKAGFEIFRELYVFKSNYEEKMYDKMVSYNLHGHLYHPHCGYINRKRGIASGSVFTNIIGSISNVLMMNYTSFLLGLDYKYIYVCGDDNLIATTEVLNVKSMVHTMKKVFGVTINFTDEGIVDKHCENSLFLGSYWTPDGPERDLSRMMLSACKTSWK